MRPLLIITSISAVVVVVGCAQKSTPDAKAAPAHQVISVEEEPTFIRVLSQRTGKEITPGIDIFADGRCLVRKFDGTEFEKRLRPDDVHGLLQFFERQGLFNISQASIERAIDGANEIVWKELPDGSFQGTSPARSWTTHMNHTRIGAVSDSTNVWISRYDLAGEVGQYSTVAELQTVSRCVERVYEVAGKISK